MVFWVGSCDWFLRVSAGMEREEEGRFSLLLPVFICVFVCLSFCGPLPRISGAHPLGRREPFCWWGLVPSFLLFDSLSHCLVAGIRSFEWCWARN